MTLHALWRQSLVVGLAVLLGPAALGAAPEAESPWAKVPALPTGCYSDSDGFPEKIAAAEQAVDAELSRQQEINRQLTDQLNEMDPMEQASRMQQFMMENPEEGMKLMQRNQALGQTYSEADTQAWEALFRELEELKARYVAALEKARAPFDAKFEDLDVRAQKDMVVRGETYVYNKWAVEEWNVLTSQWNKEYERICGEWWPESGLFHGWLKRYRDRLVQRIPIEEEADSVAVGFMAPILNSPTASYKPTATQRAARDYMREAARIFGLRKRGPDRLSEYEGP